MEQLLRVCVFSPHISLQHPVTPEERGVAVWSVCLPSGREKGAIMIMTSGKTRSGGGEDEGEGGHEVASNSRQARLCLQMIG